jgi:hypothetical protein
MAEKTRTAREGHRWAFTRIGGVDQVVLRDGRDIEHIPELDQKLWAALAMPRKAAGILPETLAALDADGDGRIRAPEIAAAVRLCSASLATLDELLAPGESLTVKSLKPGPLAETAAWVLEHQGKAGAAEISLADVRAGIEQFAKQRFNGDGVVPAAAAQDEGVAALVNAIIEAGFAADDRSGARGASAAGLAAFVANARAALAWLQASRAVPSILPLGAGTARAWAAVDAVRAKGDDYFLRASLAAISGSAVGGGAAWGQEQRLAAVLTSAIRRDSPELLELPLAAAAGDLDLAGPVNPAWAGAVEELSAAAAALLGEGGRRLDAASWERAKATLAPYGAWLATRPSGGAAALGEARLSAVLQGQQLAHLEQLIGEDAGWAAKRDHLATLFKLVIYRRDLFRILRNFVSFGDFYARRDAVFQAGALYLDGRECRLCLEVENAAAHATTAMMSGAYLVYCDCSRKDGRRKSIVAALTAGEAGNLFVGKNGIFYDNEGADWDARVSRLQVQPISIREAFFSPYRWLARTVEDLIAKRAAAAEAGGRDKMKGQAETAVATVSGAAGKSDAKTEIPKKIDVGTVAAIGVALGSIGAMVTGILAAFVGMGAWMPVGLGSILLLISGPSMILAYLKLRKRNLGPILDAEGWAVNGRLLINVPFGGTLTRLAALPSGSERRLQDPFAEKKRPWGLYFVILVVVALAAAWALGVADRFVPEALRLKTLLGG